MARRIRKSKNKEISKRNERKIREKRRRQKTYLPYLLIFILLSTSIFFIARSISHNVDRNIANIERAIKNDDRQYIKNKMDRLDVIMEVLGSSYSDDENKKKEFLKNNFENLEIHVLNKADIAGGKEVSLEISNVNYIDCYDKVKNIDEKSQHAAYMKELSKKNQDIKKADAKVFLKKKLFGYQIYESRDFINAIIGGALDKVK